MDLLRELLETRKASKLLVSISRVGVWPGAGVRMGGRMDRDRGERRSFLVGCWKTTK